VRPALQGRPGDERDRQPDLRVQGHTGQRQRRAVPATRQTARGKAQRFIDAGATDLAVRESTGTPEEAERTRTFLRSLLDD
jgi:hypothetical protein